MEALLERVRAEAAIRMYPQVGGIVASETVKCGHESHGTRMREWLPWRGPLAIVNEGPKDYDLKFSVEKSQVVTLKGLPPRWTDSR
jgi:hypothetical protein